MLDIEELASLTIDTSMGIHIDIGPGLLESVYERLLANRLQSQGLKVDRQMPVGAKIDGFDFPDAFRFDLLVEDKLLIELKSVERLAPVHAKQTLTYLRLMQLPLGLLINFGGMTLKEGIKRVANNTGKASTDILKIFAPLRETLFPSSEPSLPPNPSTPFSKSCQYGCVVVHRSGAIPIGAEFCLGQHLWRLLDLPNPTPRRLPAPQSQAAFRPIAAIPTPITAASATPGCSINASSRSRG